MCDATHRYADSSDGYDRRGLDITEVVLPANKAADDHPTKPQLKERSSTARSLQVHVRLDGDLPVAAKKLKAKQHKRRGSNPSSSGKKKGGGAKSESAKSRKKKKGKSKPKKQDVTLQLLIDFDAPRGAT